MDTEQSTPIHHGNVHGSASTSPSHPSHRNVSNGLTDLKFGGVSRRKAASVLRKCSCCCLFSFLVVLLQTHISEGRRLYGGSSTTSNTVSSTNKSNPGSRDSDSIAMCFFRTGDAARDGKLTPFYVPENDKHMYEEGVRDYLQKMGASAEQLSVVCEELKGNKEVKCELCLYNEISADQKHVRQGQVIDSMLLQCMRGTFDQAAVMNKSHYYPICYPQPRQRVNRELITQCEQNETAEVTRPSKAASPNDRKNSPQLEDQAGAARSATGQIISKQ